MELLEKEGINPTILGCLSFIKLNSSPTDFVTEIIKTKLFEFEDDTGQNPAKLLEDRGYIKYIKTGKKDTWYRVRLSDKGEEILKSLTQKPLNIIAEECWTVLEEAYKLYDMDDKKVINKTKTTYFISEFLYEKERLGKNYTTKMFQALVYDYLNSIKFDEKHFVKKTLNLLYDPSNKFATKWNIEDCPLWGWSDKNSERIKQVYRKIK